MRVDVEYTAQLRAKAGIPSEMIELEANATIADLLVAIAARHDIREFLNGSLLCFVGASQSSIPSCNSAFSPPTGWE